MGISVNVALIFSPERYTDVMDAYISGLERAKARGRDLSQIRSVASFPITLIDAEIDRRLIAIGSPAAEALLGHAGIANAALAYQAYEQTFAGRRWASLAALNAHKQRPLWATHTVKPDVIDSLYLETLLTPETVAAASPDAINAAAEQRCMNSKAVRFSKSRALQDQPITFLRNHQSLQSFGICCSAGVSVSPSWTRFGWRYRSRQRQVQASEAAGHWVNADFVRCR